jgi:plasmid replication initiation protein
MGYTEIEPLRGKKVKKANDLIRRSRFDLSLQQMKMMLYLISQIKPGDKEFKTYSFNIREFCMICGIDYNNGGNYSYLKEQIKKIADKSIWVKIEDGESLLRWIEKARFNENSGTIEIRLDEDLKPFLLQLRANYTQYELIYTLRLKSKYALRAYEYFSSIYYQKLKPYEWTVGVIELKDRLGAANYSRIDNFISRALKPAVEEINLYSDIHISYEKVKTGRVLTGFKFRIETKDIADRVKIAAAIDQELNKYIAAAPEKEV